MNKTMIIHLLVFLSVSINRIDCNAWDNIFSQTQASVPILPSESFNFEFDLPEQYGINAIIDFNKEINILTIIGQKSILFQKVNILKAQLDLNSLILSSQQLLLGCNRYRWNSTNSISKKLTQNKSSSISKSYMFLVNLFFKFIGTKQLQKGIFAKGITYNAFQFAALDLIKDPKQILKTIQQRKDTLNNQFGDMYEQNPLDGLNLQNFDLQLLKFVILTDQKSGDIQKAYRNKEMKEQLSLKLSSNQKVAINCKSEIQQLTVKDLKKALQFAMQNKGIIKDVLKL